MIDSNSYIKSQQDNLDFGQEIKIKEILKAISRRRKIALISGFAVIFAISSYTIYRRLFNPVYVGSFTLLITDPLDSDNSGSRPAGVGGTIFEELARNTTKNDIPTLKEVLKSPNLINPFALKYDIPLFKFRKNLSITTPGEKRFGQARGFKS